MNLPQPYIGITGIVTYSDVNIAHGCAEIVRELAPTHRLMTGVLVSYKTLYHRTTTNQRYPGISAVDKLLEECGDFGAWPVIHYNSHAKGEEFAEELELLYYLCPAMRGIQLNVVTPDPGTVQYFANKYPEVEIILQVNHTSLVETAIPPAQIVQPWQYIERYTGIRHALIDSSGGNGRVFPPQTANDIIKILDGLEERGVHLGIAGGLGPDCGDLLEDLRIRMVGYWGDLDIELVRLSYDAESRIRVPVPNPIAGDKYQDQLDHDKAVGYVQIVCEALKGITQ